MTDEGIAWRRGRVHRARLARSFRTHSPREQSAFAVAQKQIPRPGTAPALGMTAQGEPLRRNAALGGYGSAGSVPCRGGFMEVGVVGHVAADRGVVAEGGVFHRRPSRSHRLEKVPQVVVKFAVARRIDV